VDAAVTARLALVTLTLTALNRHSCVATPHWTLELPTDAVISAFSLTSSDGATQRGSVVAAAAADPAAAVPSDGASRAWNLTRYALRLVVPASAAPHPAEAAAAADAAAHGRATLTIRYEQPLRRARTALTPDEAGGCTLWLPLAPSEATDVASQRVEVAIAEPGGLELLVRRPF
jgi:hypothetical protein